MKRSRAPKGFTLLELLVATAIFMVICAAMFGLLQISQQKYVVENQLSGTFQEAHLAMDQIVHDINISGYPSLNMFSYTPPSTSYAVAPLAWDPNYPSSDCQIGSTCSPTPGDFDLIVETNLGGSVSWIHYQLQNTTLLRGVVAKTAGADPVSATAFSTGLLTPLVNNVVNNAAQPIFVYSCSTPTGSQPCTTAGAYNAPKYISDVDITLIVQTQERDPQTQSFKVIELTGRGHRTNSQN